MGDRKTITVTEAAYEQLAAAKRDEESFTDTVLRLTDGEPPDGGGEHGPHTLTEDHIEDIATLTASRTAAELEQRLR